MCSTLFTTHYLFRELPPPCPCAGPPPPRSRDCRTQAAPSRAGFGGWVGGWGARSGEARTARPQGEHVPHEPASGGRWKNMPHGHRGQPRAGLTRAGLRGRARAARAGLRGGSGKLVTFVLHHPRARDARERKIEFFRILPAVSVVLYRGSLIDHFQKDGQNSQFLNFLRKCPLNNTPYGSHPLTTSCPSCSLVPHRRLLHGPRRTPAM